MKNYCRSKYWNKTDKKYLEYPHSKNPLHNHFSIDWWTDGEDFRKNHMRHIMTEILDIHGNVIVDGDILKSSTHDIQFVVTFNVQPDPLESGYVNKKGSYGFFNVRQSDQDQFRYEIIGNDWHE